MDQIHNPMLEPGSCARPSEESVDKNYRATNLAAYTAVSIEGLAGFMSKDPDLWVFQNFNRLNLTNIIYLQQRLVDLERQLDEIVHQPVTEFDKPKYEELMGRLETLLSKYESALVAQARRQSLRLPEKEPITCLDHYCASARSFLDYRPVQGRRDQVTDYVSIAAEEKGWIHRLVVEGKFFKSALTTRKESNITKLGGSASFPSVLVVSDPNVRRIERTVINLGFCLLLLCPILALTYLENKALKVGIVLLFVLIISTLTIDLGKSTNATCVALVAGYTAILVAFLSNGGVA